MSEFHTNTVRDFPVLPSNPDSCILKVTCYVHCSLAGKPTGEEKLV